MSRFRRAGTLLLLFFAFFVNQVVCRGRKGGGSRGGGGGSSSGDSSSSLNLPPGLTAVFTIVIIIAVITLYQLSRAATRLKKLVLPEGTPTLPYDVGKLFPAMLFAYLLLYLLSNILYAVFIMVQYNGSLGRAGGIGLSSGSAFVSQLADVLFFGVILCIIAYRQRIQLNPAEKLFNLKSFLDGWLLSTILILGIAMDAIQAAATGDPFFDPYAYPNLSTTYQIFTCIAGLDVAATAIMAHKRLQASGIHDNIVRSAAFFVTPFMLIGSLFRIVDAGIVRTPSAPVNRISLLIVRTVILGIVAIAVASFALLMGAPPKPPKDSNKNVQYETVQKA